MSRMRLRIAERLKQSQNTAAFLTTFNEIDMSALMSFRSKFKDDILKRHGVKLGFMSAFVKASCLALQEIPVANASIEGDQIVYRDYVDVSVAVSTEKGLVTPVLRNAESMSFLDIEQGIVGLGKKARDNKLTLEDLAGGTFTVSNGGVFGSLYGTPIINTPQSAVLGMHAIKDKPVVVDGQIVIRPIMVVALTYDHRLLDGREAVTFLVRVKELIENPALLENIKPNSGPTWFLSTDDLMPRAASSCLKAAPRTRRHSSLAPTVSALLSQARATSTSDPSSAAHPTSTASSPPESSTATTLHGWIKSCRRQKRVAFAVLNDGSTTAGVQCVLDPVLAEPFVDSPGKQQDKEFRVDGVEVLGNSDAQAYPIQNMKQGMPQTVLRKLAHLRARTSSSAAMLRLRSEMAYAMAASFRRQGFIKVETPIVTSSDCEGAGEVFRVSSGETKPAPADSPQAANPKVDPKYLTVSGQLHLEAISAALNKVYCFSPAFRAEKSDTARHLQEFWMLEAECGFLDDDVPTALDQVMTVAELNIRDIVAHVKESSDVALFKRQSPELESNLNALSKPFQRMTYTKAVQLLQDHVTRHPETFQHDVKWSLGLQTEHEKFLADQVVNGPVFVTDYPTRLKPFYMLPSRLDSLDHKGDDEKSTTACFDLLVPRLGELVGGSLREHRLPNLVQALARHGLDQRQYDWYLDLRRFGTTMHGGYGLGWERLVACLTGFDNVRDCIAFPRAAEGSRF
ncbi:asparaginyl-tRNA synthetase [Microbotryomycetes sp. JL201]|nr:asparaginyl-tRNA synthetase [Microbotryomycetes sp. JL201]